MLNTRLVNVEITPEFVARVRTAHARRVRAAEARSAAARRVAQAARTRRDLAARYTTTSIG